MLSDRSNIASTINNLNPAIVITDKGDIRLSVEVNDTLLTGSGYSIETAALMLKSRYERHTEEWSKILKMSYELQNTGGDIALFLPHSDEEQIAGTRDSAKIVAYICHPVEGESEEEKGVNLVLIAELYREICLNEPYVIPFIPYYIASQALHEDVEAERNIAIKGNAELLSRDFVDEVRLYGDCIDKQMSHEIVIAMLRNIPVRPMTPETVRGYQATFSKVKPASNGTL